MLIKNTEFRMRISEREFQAIKSAARKAGKSMSQLVREHLANL